MIVKPFAPSSWTLGLQALVRRLPSSHPQYITFQQELKNKEAGDFAEQYILKELQKLPQLSDCYLFHDVILPTILPLQMDRLIITASGIVLLEIKNIRGTVHFKNNPRQLIRTTNKGEVLAFTLPEIQLEQYIQAMHLFLTPIIWRYPFMELLFFLLIQTTNSHGQRTSNIFAQNHQEKYGDSYKRNNKHYFVTITAQKPISALPLLSTCG